MKRVRFGSFVVLLAAVMLSAGNDAAAASDSCPAWFPAYCDCEYGSNYVEITCQEFTWCDTAYPEFCDDVEAYCWDLAYKREWMDWYCDDSDFECWGLCVLGPVIED